VEKMTIPPGFGLTPAVQTFAVPNLQGEDGSRQVLEFVPASPIEYLDRWRNSNDLFGDDAQLEFVAEWADGSISFVISQPQYHGVPAEPRDIEHYFGAAGWTRLKYPSGHLVFFNYAFQVIAIDAAGRNCYLTDGELQPFDVILCQPGPELEEFLRIYPG
jgi:hypothetical protein